MVPGVLASKKNRLILLGLVAAAGLILYVSYGKSLNLQRQELIGGQIELVINGQPLSNEEKFFVKSNSSRVSYVADIVTEITLSKGPFVAHVRVMDDAYPLIGKIELVQQQTRTIFTEDKEKKIYGVAVNPLFLQKSGANLGSIITIGNSQYHLQAFIESLPDQSGRALLAKPLIMMKHSAVAGSGLYRSARSVTGRWRIMVKNFSEEEWQKKYQEEFGWHFITINRWNAE